MLKTMWKKIKKFLSALCLQTFATFFAGLLFLAMTVAIIMIYVVKEGPDFVAPAISKHPVLVVDLGKDIVEKEDNIALIYNDIGFLSKFQKIPLSILLKTIKKASEDPNIKIMYLRLDNFKAGWATVSDLYYALMEFRKKGKIIYAYAENYEEKSYLLASIAHQVILYPAGMFEFNGLMSPQVYFKGLFEKLKIHPQIFRVGKFKSAVEPFYLDKMGKEARLQTQEMLDDFWRLVLEKIQSNRHLLPSFLQKVAQTTPFLQPEMAKAKGFVDHLLPETGVMALIQKKLKEILGQKEMKKKVSLIKVEESALTVEEAEADESAQDKNFNKNFDPESITRFWHESTMSWSQYARGIQFKEMTDLKLGKKAKVAIVYVLGEIIDGSAQEGQTGSETMVQTLRELGDNKEVKAIVLRISSPGGSASASDVIWSEIRRIKAFKPVIASMGDVAASGAYYIAAATDKIYARTNTITGSIGVFGIVISSEEFFHHYLGVSFDNVETAPYADTTYTQRPLRKDEKEIIQNQIDLTYERFLQRVEIGRPNQLNSLGKKGELATRVAEGRVFSGQRALGLKLVDEIGGLVQAIDYAAKKAHLKKGEFVLEEYPKVQSPIQDIFSMINSHATMKVNPLNIQWPVYYQRQLMRGLPLLRLPTETSTL